jgi:hypothetical protein
LAIATAFFLALDLISDVCLGSEATGMTRRRGQPMSALLPTSTKERAYFARRETPQTDAALRADTPMMTNATVIAGHKVWRTKAIRSRTRQSEAPGTALRRLRKANILAFGRAEGEPHPARRALDDYRFFICLLVLT